MPLVLLAFLPVVVPAGDVFERYAAWSKAHPAFTVKGDVAATGTNPPVSLEMRLRRPDSIWLRFAQGTTDYRLSKTPAGQTETDAAERVYDESPAPPALYLNPSKISGLPDFGFPSILLGQDVKPFFPGKPTATKAKLNGVDVEVVHTLQEGPEGRYEAWGWFAPSGEPRQCRVKVESPNGRHDTTWRFASFGALPAAPFALEIPSDYMPHRLDSPAFPPSMGAALKLGVWKRAGTDVDLDAEAGGTTLVALLSPGTAPSDRIAPVLVDLEKGGLKVIRVGEEGANPALAYDPTGKHLAALGAPGTPFLVLMKEGKVAGLWFGADKDPKATVDDIQAALKE